MVNVFLYENYRQFLIDEFQRRKLRNQHYSLRAFARDTGMSLSRVSEILAHEVSITLTSAKKIAEKLGFCEVEKEYFIHLILSQYARTADLRKKSKLIVKKYRAKKLYFRLRTDYSSLLARWYYPALIELVVMKTSPTMETIAKILKISEEEATAAVLHLQELGQLNRDAKGLWEKPRSFLKIESATPSALIRKAHRKTLEQAYGAIESQPLEKRKYLSSYFGIRKENLPEARRDLEQLSANFLKRYVSENNADAVYCFSLQLFAME